MKNKKGTSLIELIAVIVIMGIIAAIAVPTTVSVINIQKKKATIAGLNNTYSYVKGLLITTNVGELDPAITKVEGENAFYYTYVSKILELGYIDGQFDLSTEVYFCYDGNYSVYIGEDAPTEMPSKTEDSIGFTLENYTVFWDSEKNIFVSSN